jgi:uncharacterized membrane protein YhhN
MARTRLRGAAYLALAAADTVLAGRDAGRLRRLTKPLLMPALSGAFLGAADRAPVVPRRATLAAQALSGAGDIALLGHGDRAFLAGLGSFFGAHVAYLVGLGSLRDRDGSPLARRGTRVALGLWAVAGPAMTLAARRRDPTLAVPVAGYVTILSAVLGAATTLDPALPAAARRRIASGAALFLVSDTVLGIRELVLDERSATVDALVMASYTAGQGLIAAGVAELSGP